MRLVRLCVAFLVTTAATAAVAQSIVTLDATSGTNTISTSYTTTGGLTLDMGFFAEYLVLAGGGGGGGSGDNTTAYGGGGGGAGGLLTGTTTLTSATYSVVVGGGGAGGQYSATTANQQGTNGANSVFGAITATGGGGGGSFKVVGNAGGSGGGGGGRGAGTNLRTDGGSGTAGQGFDGGASRDDNASGRSAGGGGGGAGAVGGTGGTDVTTAGNGGAGLASTITGSSVTYGGGGGGGAMDTNASAPETAGTGGTGGGGAGSTSGGATAGTDGLGGGGGGVGNGGAGGRGGAGLVIVRYQGASLGNIGGTVTTGSGSAAGYTLNTFTTTGTTTGTSALNLSGVNMNTRLGATLTGTLSGTGGITYNGPGILTLAGSNTYVGTTTVASGQLRIDSTAALPGWNTPGRLAVNSGASLVVTNNVADADVATMVTAGTFAANSNVGFDTSLGDRTLGAAISGSFGLIKMSSNALTISAATAYSGTTSVLAGSLVVNHATALQLSPLTVAAGASVGFGPGVSAATPVSIGSLSGSGTVNLANSALEPLSVTVGGNNDSTTFAGRFSGNGTLTKAGSGTLILTTSGTYASLPYVGFDRMSVSVTSGTFLSGTTGAVSYFVGGTASGGASLDVSGGLFKAGTSPTTYGIILGLAAGASGTATISGGVIETYRLYVGQSGSGTLIASGGELRGTLVVGEGYGGGRGTVTITGGTVGTAFNSHTIGAQGGPGGTLAMSGGVLLGGLEMGRSAVTLTGGTMSLSNFLLLGPGSPATFDMSGGSLQVSAPAGIGQDNGTGSMVISGGTFATNYAYSPVSLKIGSSGAGSLTITGAGVVIVNSGTGTVSLGAQPIYPSNGILYIGNGGVAGTLQAREVNGGVGGGKATVAFNHTGTSTFSPALTGTMIVYKFNLGTTVLTGSSTFTGTTTISAGTLQVGDGGTAGSLGGGTVVNSAALVFNGSGTSTYGGSIRGKGTLTKLGAGALTLSGSNSFTGQTTVSAGTLILNSANALAPTAAVVVAGGATLQANQPIRIGYLDSAGTVTGSNNLTATLTVTRSGTIGGIANGTDGQGAFAAGIVKLGTGTSTVNAANTYTGLTWVREGTLAVGAANAFDAASSLTVDSGATLDRAGYSATVTNADLNGTVANAGGGGLLTVTGTLSGSGVVAGPVTVAGVHAPGNSPGIQTFTSDLTYLVAAAVNWELTEDTASNSPVVFDQVVLSGTSNLTFSGSTALNLSFDGAGSLVDWSDAFWNVSRAWTIFDLSAGTTSGFELLSLVTLDWLDGNGATLSSLRNGSTFSVGLVGQDVVLSYTAVAVPEPATTVLVATAAACLALRRRRRAAGAVAIQNS